MRPPRPPAPPGGCPPVTSGRGPGPTRPPAGSASRDPSTCADNGAPTRPTRPNAPHLPGHRSSPRPRQSSARPWRSPWPTHKDPGPDLSDPPHPFFSNPPVPSGSLPPLIPFPPRRRPTARGWPPSHPALSSVRLEYRSGEEEEWHPDPGPPWLGDPRSACPFGQSWSGSSYPQKREAPLPVSALPRAVPPPPPAMFPCPSEKESGSSRKT